jgi:hypothetical protein
VLVFNLVVDLLHGPFVSQQNPASI